MGHCCNTISLAIFLVNLAVCSKGPDLRDFLPKKNTNPFYGVVCFFNADGSQSIIRIVNSDGSESGSDSDISYCDYRPEVYGVFEFMVDNPVLVACAIIPLGILAFEIYNYYYPIDEPPIAADVSLVDIAEIPIIEVWDIYNGIP